MKKEQYVPSSGEVKKADEIMTDEQKKMSEEREQTYEAGYKELERKNNEQYETPKTFEECKDLLNFITMEKIKQTIENITPKNVEEAVKCFQDGKTKEAIMYLRENRNDISEFCLQIKDCYSEKDTTTPILKLAQLIDELL